MCNRLFGRGRIRPNGSRLLPIHTGLTCCDSNLRAAILLNRNDPGEQIQFTDLLITKWVPNAYGIYFLAY
eukprot:SAG31_NODE_4473_length_3203_cov_2.743557_3_plen_70_part_00